ncbi:uncharacterized protein VTP21DRAFT_3150 [Calcarisporiella thermophila]|uniref:uncharacterized protein n=1 Tax=Calcarisporiella thermophila TaxID=911321 RepID=UPI00374387C6
MKVLAILDEGGKYSDNPNMLGCVENELKLREWLEYQMHTYIVTSNISGAGNVMDKELPDTDVLITTPYYPVHITAERIAMAKKLKLIITAGIGSDQIDITAAKKANITVIEITESHSVSVAEHAVMTMLILLRNFIPAHEQIVRGDWNPNEAAAFSQDIADKIVGTVGCGRVGSRVLRRLKGFGCKELVYFDPKGLDPGMESELGVRRCPTLCNLIEICDVINISCPLTEETFGLFNRQLFNSMKRGVIIVNTARGALVDRDALVEAVHNGIVRGYGGDAWYPHIPPKDHPWRTMPHNAMVPHYAGSTLDSQERFAERAMDTLQRFLRHEPMRQEDIIVGEAVYLGEKE